MDDLSSVEWTAPKAATATQQYPQPSGNYYPALRPTPPLYGSSTPSVLHSNQKIPNNGPARNIASTPANDSFANLVSFHPSLSSKTLSLQEQQRKLQDEKSKQEAGKKKAFDAHFGTPQETSWGTLGDGRSTPNRITSPPTYAATDEYGGQKLSKIINKPFAGIPAYSTSNTRAPIEDDVDILAAFNASAPVDKSSYMPDPSRSTSIDRSDACNGIGNSASSSTRNNFNGTGGGHMEDLDDDPFGLGTNGYTKASNAITVESEAADDDDVLGLLGRPVSEFPSKQKFEPATPEPSKEDESHPQDRAVAELVDMGFPSERSRKALETTESGTDVQAAVGWLLNQAHEESRNKTQTKYHEEGVGSQTQQSRRTPGRRKSSTSGAPKPAWIREQERPNASKRRPDSKSPVNGEKDPTQYASDLGNKMFKTAGSLWKTGTKKLNQAVSEFNSDSESSQPKWMREAQPEIGVRKRRPRHRESDVIDDDDMKDMAKQKGGAPTTDATVTDEALMLEGGSRPLRPSRPKADLSRDNFNYQKEKTPTFTQKSQEQALPQPKFMQQAQAQDPKAKLSRQVVEEETSQAYISPARRKRPTPKPTPTESEPDLLFDSTKPSRLAPSAPRPNPISQSRSIATTLPSRPAPPKRNIPTLTSFALRTLTKERQEGNGAFKRGDYAQATTHYSTSLAAIPPTHPLAIILLTNRSLSHSKTGDPKASMADAKLALDLIGPSRGASETIDPGADEGVKEMSTYWEKAMTRQAESLEHLERWADAAAIWRICVEAGVGGATSITGRRRCEKAAALPSQPKPSAAPKKAALKPRPKVTALGDLASDSESVTRLRAANAAADRLDDEKFALADMVDGRISRWRAGKEGNLRALLSTLENVLWEDSGWEKVGMGDVLLPGKVKLGYMKGIAKVHPDKLPTTATTEQKMISVAVFATLNEAWERFKATNNL